MNDEKLNLQDNLLTLPEAALTLPRVGGKGTPHPSTLWRWCRLGLGGVKLEYLRLGRRIVTSREALDRFAKALAESDDR